MFYCLLWTCIDCKRISMPRKLIQTRIKSIMNLRRLTSIKVIWYLVVLILIFGTVALATVHATDHGDTFFGADSHENTCQDDPGCDDEEINIVFTFMNAVKNRMLQDQFTLTVSSMFQHATIPLVIHIIGEEESQRLAAEIIKKNSPEGAKYRVSSKCCYIQDFDRG